MYLDGPDATDALGRRLGALAEPGQVVALVGDLGAGKSALARGIARGLGLTERIPSPTFVIANTYTDGRIPFHHLDLYRLGDPDELEQLGLDELIAEGVSAVEWADLFPEILPDDHLELRIVQEGEGRRVEATPHGPRSRALWDGVA
ncbi:MAG: tRNA (adenosine(37)-N6)-threonylcarbamoyltransferase complex ATPase subunit type 1 TsaE [Myxococcales bacterium]|nr:tRNA (adenosine(37)-N6)-threonylcarbamoyltransferase complex ATPase subunit type 1 TsaE [Myxococcales bacterium]